MANTVLTYIFADITKWQFHTHLQVDDDKKYNNRTMTISSGFCLF